MQTRIGLSIVTVLSIAVGLSGVSSVMAAQKSSTGKDVKSLSEHAQVTLALSRLLLVSPRMPPSWCMAKMGN